MNTFVRTLHRELKSVTFFRFLEVIVIAVFSIALIRDTYEVGNDFQVFYKTTQYFFSGISIYDLSHAREMVFKYPPWIFPLFIPFGLLPYAFSALIWGLVQVASLFAVGKFLATKGANSWALRLCFILYWGLWAVHALDGQVMLPLLALGLIFYDQARVSSRWAAVFTFLFSVKIFTLFALVPILKNVFRWKTELIVLGLVVVGFGVAYSRCQEKSPGEFIESWRRAASSGSAMMEGNKTRGRENQGIPVLALRVMNVPQLDVNVEMAVTAVCTFILFLFGWWATRNLEFFEKVFVWLPLCAAIHPLSWFHGFTWAFPLSVMSLTLGIQSKNKWWIGLSLLGTSFITVVTEKTLGEFGKTLELYSIKSIGVIFLIIAYRRFSVRMNRTKFQTSSNADLIRG